ncbi:hypothetical protein [Actinomyces israelii]|uniref:hypothetical protein n=1 Tax=Actinomyces israelii TaxID=1659 RepID=UPI0023563734|nr:hypothetical protein [Actinomyces israelii]
MFTGIVEELGRIERVEHAGSSARLTVRAPRVMEGTRPGGSICVSGLCQRVLPDRCRGRRGPRLPGSLTVCLIPETLRRTTLGGRRPGDSVNLEVDVMAKYIERLLGAGARPAG